MRNISLIFRRVAKSVALLAILSMATLFVQAQDIKEGESLFKADCSACHGVDRAVIGPALKGATVRHDEAWLISWIQNSSALIASGDETAIKLFEDHNKLMMPAFPTLTEDNIRNILAYVDDASKPAPAAAAGAEGAAAQQAGANGDVSNFMFGGLIVVLIIAFLVILVLNRVIRTLDRIILKSRIDIAEGEEGEDEGGESSGKVFVDKLKKLSRNKKLVFFVVLGIVALLSTAGWNVMWNVGVHEGYQ